MRTRIKSTPNSPRRSVQVIKSQRIPGKKHPQQIIVQHIGIAKNEQHAQQLKNIGDIIIAQIEAQERIKKEKNNPQRSMFDLADPKEKTRFLLQDKKQRIKELAAKTKNNKTLKVDLKKIREEKRVTTGVHEVCGAVYNELGLDNLLPKSLRAAREALFHCVMARIIQPDSKRATVKMLDQNCGHKTSLATMYRSMDRLNDKVIENLQNLAFTSAEGVLGGPVKVLFFDATTLYFESFKDDDLKQSGYSKDGKFKEMQIVVAIMVTEEGLPVGFEVLPGSSFEGKSLLPVVERMKKKFDLKQAVCVADRGMLNSANIKALEKAGVQYIMAAKLKSLSKDKKEYILSQKEKLKSGSSNEARYLTLDHNGAQIIVTYSHQRALREQKERDKMLRKLKKKVNATKSPKSLMGNNGSRKYLKLRGSSTVVIDEAKIKKDALWDGLHGVVTSVSGMTPEQVFTHKHGLWQVEETFRVAKHDLRFRPIYHWTPRRVLAHIAIAFMSLLCVRHLEYRVKLQYKKMSSKEIIGCLTEVQHSVVQHIHTKKRYSIPSKASPDAHKIYRLMGLKHNLEPLLLG